MSFRVVIYGFQTQEEAEEARKKAQFEFAKWAAVVSDEEAYGLKAEDIQKLDEKARKVGLVRA